MNATNDRDGIAITDLAQARSSLLLIRAALDRADSLPASLELMRATTEFFLDLDDHPTHTRPTDEMHEYAYLCIDGPPMARSAALLIESGLEMSAQQPGALPATRRVVCSLLAYVEAINPAADPDPGPA